MTAPALLDADVHDRARQWGGGTWYQREAALAIGKGHYVIIHGRNSRDVYLVRCWLHQPRTADDGGWESGNSVLLHWFPRADDDAALHDHPWDFRTTILEGGYREHLPPTSWKPGSELGPVWDLTQIFRLGGTTVHHAAEDLHCVGSLLGRDCWTLVRTGPRRRDWGFHPEGERWQPWREFLARKTARLAKGGAA